MKPHLKKYGWLYGAIAFAVLHPLFFWWIQWVPPLSMDTYEKMAAYLDTEMERRYGPPLGEKYIEMTQHMGFMPDEKRYERVCRNYTISLRQAKGVLDDDLNELEKQHGGKIKTLEAIGRGRAYYPLVSDDKSKTQPYSNYLYLLQIPARLQRALTQRTIWSRDWDKALQELKVAGHFSDAIRTYDNIGCLIAIACRSIANDGYRELLAADPPPDVMRQALDDLLELRSTEPAYDALSDLALSVHNFMEYEATGIHETSREMFFHQDKTLRLLRLWFGGTAGEYWSNQSSNPGLRSQARRNLARVEGFNTIRDGNRESYPDGWRSSSMRLQWTTARATIKLVHRLYQEDPSFFSYGCLSDDLLESLDPWTVVAVAWGFGDTNMGHFKIRERVGATKGRLTELAFAARIYKSEQGNWPTSVDQLVPAYVPAATTARGFAPIQLGEIKVDAVVRETLWSRLSSNFQHCYFESGMAPNVHKPTSEVGWDASHWGNDPIMPLVYAQALASHSNLVSEANAQYMKANGKQWIPITADLAWKITRKNEASKKTGRYYTNNARAALDRIRITATLHSPDSVFAIWSPGPYGKDNGGRVIYDPIKGINSKGDIIVYPEGY
jgi:hypothetical protein